MKIKNSSLKVELRGCPLHRFQEESSAQEDK